MDVSFWAWALPITAIVGLLLLEVVGHVRTSPAPPLRASALRSAVQAGIAILVGLLVLGLSALSLAVLLGTLLVPTVAGRAASHRGRAVHSAGRPSGPSFPDVPAPAPVPSREPLGAPSSR